MRRFIALRFLASFLPTCVAALLFTLAAGGSSPAAAALGSGVEVTADVTPQTGPTAGARVVLRLTGVTDAAGATISYTLDGAGRIVQQDASPLRPGAPASREVLVAFDPAQRIYLNVFTRQAGRGGGGGGSSGSAAGTAGRQARRSGGAVPGRPARPDGIVEQHPGALIPVNFMAGATAAMVPALPVLSR